ncbi:MAG: hypothetical protein KKG59_03335 [Nanoarchaeota archaeon]|nr:hypothetical protein [Nanoarchaeota archaeon]
MKEIKRNIRNGLVSILVYGGMGLYGLGIPLAVYLDHIQPEKPQIVSEYEFLDQKIQYLMLGRRFSLDNVLDSEYMEQYVQRADSISTRLTDIESSDDFEKISQYKEEKKKHNKYWILPILSGILGIMSMVYGVHLETRKK